MAERLTFSRGEVAIYVGPSTAFYGNELTVASGLIHEKLYREGQSSPEPLYEGPVYRVEAPWLGTPRRRGGWAVRPEWLRKRPPKQDWNKICYLNSVGSGEFIDDGDKVNQWGFRDAVV